MTLMRSLSRSETQSLFRNTKLKAALYLFVMAALAGLCLIAAGVFLLAGLGWALVAGGVCLLVCAAFIRSGLREVTSG